MKELLYLPRVIFDPVVLTPPRKIEKFMYHCGKHFLIEPIEDLFKTAHKRFGILQVFGEETIVQVCDEYLDIKTLDCKTTKLQKRQDRGGQSQNRIARLRLETIHNYLKSAGEKAEHAYLTNGLPNIEALLIIGPGMKKEQILNYINIPVEKFIYSIDKPNTNITIYINEMITSTTSTHDEKHISYIEDLINRSPELITFGQIETLTAVKNNEIATVYTNISVHIDFPCIKIHSNWLSTYDNMIGIRYMPKIDIEE